MFRRRFRRSKGGVGTRSTQVMDRPTSKPSAPDASAPRGSDACVEPLESRTLMSVSATAAPLTSPANVNGSFTFATFTSDDPAPKQRPTSFTAAITFGDGKKGKGRVTQAGSAFSVTAAHKYKQPGVYSFTVAIKDKVDKR